MSAPDLGPINDPLFRQCVNCSVRLEPDLPRHQIEELDKPKLKVLKSLVTPRLITPDDILCVDCFELLKNWTSSTTKSHASPAPRYRELCFACGMPITSRLAHNIAQECRVLKKNRPENKETKP